MGDQVLLSKLTQQYVQMSMKCGLATPLEEKRRPRSEQEDILAITWSLAPLA